VTEDAIGTLEPLDVDECFALLANHDVGRLAVVVDEQPMIFPVNYILVDDTQLLFSTDPGTKLSHSALARVAFEVDELDEQRRIGWSVVVQGTGREVTDALDARSRADQEARLEPWPGGVRGHRVRIIPRVVTGRRIVRPNST